MVKGSDIALNVFGFLGLSLLLAIGLLYVYHSFFTPYKELRLRNKNLELVSDYNFINHKIKDSKEKIKDFQTKDDYTYRTILGIDPIPPTVRQAGIGGSDKYKDIDMADKKTASLIINTLKEVEKLKNQIFIQTKSFDEIEEVFNLKQKMWNSRPAIYPLSKKDINREIHGGFGWRLHPVHKKVIFHDGIDISADRGKAIHVTGDGIVKKVYYSSTYGKVIFVDHGFGYETRYAHMSMFNVEEGEQVKRGEVIGFVGSTGTSTSNHLHYEVRLHGEFVDPLPYLGKNLNSEEYEKIIELASTSNLILEN